MNLKLDLNTAQFRAAAQDAVRIMGANAELLIKEEGRLFLKEFRMRTPPFSKGWGKPEAATDRAAGEKAVRGDIRRLAAPLEASKIKNPRLKELVVKNDEAGLQAFFDNVKDATWRARKMIRIGSIDQIHRNLRNPQGRIRKDQRMAVIANDSWFTYVKNVVSAVGFAKATFNTAALKLGARLPAYVAKIGPRGGYEEGKSPSFYIMLTGQSNVPTAQTAVDQSISIRGKKLEAELKRIISAFEKTGKIMTRRKSFNENT